jgi:hypothetical protein
MKITVKIWAFFEKMAGSAPETKFCNFKIFFCERKTSFRDMLIIKVHTLDIEKYIYIFFIFILISN